jgi:hypothetical protein
MIDKIKRAITSAHQTMLGSEVSQAHCTRASVLLVDRDAHRTPARLVAASVRRPLTPVVLSV